MLDLTALKTLAVVLSVSQDIREESFVDGQYRVSMHDSSVRAAVRVLNLHEDHPTVYTAAKLVYLLNILAWNDAQAWAANVVDLAAHAGLIEDPDSEESDD